jgi:hypothetical protein
MIGYWWLVADANLIIDLTNQADQLKAVVICNCGGCIGCGGLSYLVSLIYLEDNRVNLFESGKGGHHIR